MTYDRKADPQKARAHAKEVLAKAGVLKAPVQVERVITKLNIV